MCSSRRWKYIVLHCIVLWHGGWHCPSKKVASLIWNQVCALCVLAEPAWVAHRYSSAVDCWLSVGGNVIYLSWHLCRKRVWLQHALELHLNYPPRARGCGWVCLYSGFRGRLCCMSERENQISNESESWLPQCSAAAMKIILKAFRNSENVRKCPGLKKLETSFPNKVWTGVLCVALVKSESLNGSVWTDEETKVFFSLIQWNTFNWHSQQEFVKLFLRSLCWSQMLQLLLCELKSSTLHVLWLHSLTSSPASVRWNAKANHVFDHRACKGSRCIANSPVSRRAEGWKSRSEQTPCWLIGSSPAAGGVWYFHFASLNKYYILFGVWAELEAHGASQEEVGIVSVHLNPGFSPSVLIFNIKTFVRVNVLLLYDTVVKVKLTFRSICSYDLVILGHFIASTEQLSEMYISCSPEVSVLCSQNWKAFQNVSNFFQVSFFFFFLVHYYLSITPCLLGNYFAARPTGWLAVREVWDVLNSHANWPHGRSEAV